MIQQQQQQLWCLLLCIFFGSVLSITEGSFSRKEKTLPIQQQQSEQKQKDNDELSEKVQAWKDSGEYIQVTPFSFNMFVKQIGDPSASASKTLLLLHGNPESSFSYHKVVDGLLNATFDRIVLCDFLGFGLSDKPPANYSYSLIDQTDILFVAWNHFGVTGGHILSHDMSDSIALEILARYQANVLPAWFATDGIQSVTFTNGAMVVELADLTIAHYVFAWERLATLLGRLIGVRFISDRIMVSTHGNDNLSQQDLDEFWELINYNDGARVAYFMFRYYDDRELYEQTRWLPALSATDDVPIHICWGDEDDLATLEMAEYLMENDAPGNTTLTVMEGVGHFCQVGSPSIWLESVLGFYLTLL